MRAIILAAIVAVGFGLATSPAATAAPASGLGISEGQSNITKVQHWRWGSRRHRWRMCHRRHHSRMFRCW